MSEVDYRNSDRINVNERELWLTAM